MVDSKNWHILEFITPIFESSKKDNKFIITGTAINETTTHNGHKYIAEELEKASNTLKGKPLLKDHRNEVDAIVGKVTDSFFDKNKKSIQFEAIVTDDEIRNKIEQGVLSSVSIGAFAEDVSREEESGDLVARGLEIVELSFTPVPADRGATFALALSNNYQIKESQSIEQSTELLGEHTNKRRSKKVKEETLEENQSDELKSLKEKLAQTEALLNKTTEEKTIAQNEIRQNLVSKYISLAKEKGVEPRNAQNISEESIKLLVEQLESIKSPKKEDTSLKTEVRQDFSEHEENYMVELDAYGRAYGLWAMPDKSKWLKLHNNHPLLR